MKTLQKSQWMRVLIVAVGMLLLCVRISGCSFTFQACSHEKIKDVAMERLKGKGFAGFSAFEDFTILSEQISQNKKEQTVTFSCIFLDDTIRYTQKYKLTMKYDHEQWTVASWEEMDQASWTDVPVAGVSLAQALDDVDGYHYESNFNEGILNVSKTSSTCMQDQWEDLEKGTSGIRFTFSVKTGGAEETFDVYGDYLYVPAKGWVLQRQDISIVSKIVASIPDEIMMNAVSMFQVEYEGEAFMFSDMERIYYDVKDMQIDHEKCEAVVRLFAHGEKNLLYLNLTADCIFRYSDGWYFYTVQTYKDDITVGYINDTCMVNEELLIRTLKTRTFRYGFAKDITMADRSIEDFQIISHRISEKGYRQEVSYTYSFAMDMARFYVKGNAVYLYENNALSMYSMNGETTKIELELQGTWYAVLRQGDYIRYLMLELQPEENNTGLLNGIVRFCDVVDSDLGVIRKGTYYVKGVCDTANLMRLQLVFVQWADFCEIDNLPELTGYFDCGTNEILLDMYPEDVLVMEKPTDFIVNNYFPVTETQD